ncbi:hypothetical protein [Woodsholea maritima]|uniref:hypothetical protein n=1 Tax=Woodsholea maritima TaxID=240237 RepID=UPI00035F0566|nr:hypothetical protein [Woodsholea maritima]
MKPDFEILLSGGPRNGVGARDDAAAMAKADPSLLPSLFRAMLSQRAEVAMRAASAFDLASQNHPETIADLKEEILAAFDRVLQPDVRWHLYSVSARLDLSEAEALALAARLEGLIETETSRIAVVNALQALFDLALKFQGLREKLRVILQAQCHHEAGSIRARARKLLSDKRYRL